MYHGGAAKGSIPGGDHGAASRPDGVRSWTGTIPAGANATSSCATTPDAVEDHHATTVTVPAGVYGIVRAQFKFTVTWTGSGNDEILTVSDPGGSEVGSSDGSSPTETVITYNAPGGAYDVAACAFLSPTAQAYTGRLEISTTSTSTSLPSADPQGLLFSASVAADPQRDEAEPLIEIDREGIIYTCGPTGFSNASDYAQVSTDGGDQFHVLGHLSGKAGLGGAETAGWAPCHTKRAGPTSTLHGARPPDRIRNVTSPTTATRSRPRAQGAG